MPPAPVDEAPEASPAPPKKNVGYKSLIEANANRPTPAVPQPQADDSADKADKGNRFFRAVGKFFKGDKKDEPPTTPPQQP